MYKRRPQLCTTRTPTCLRHPEHVYVEYLHPYRLNSVREDEADLQRVVAMVAGEVSVEDHPGHLAFGLHPSQLLVPDIHLLISWGDRERETYTHRDEGERERIVQYVLL